MEKSGDSAGVKVWDPFVRAGHWLLATGVAVAWYTKEGGGVWHEWVGYAVLALVILRFLWGWMGSRYARFAQFVRSPRTTIGYVRCIFSGKEPRYLGHNPLGGCMVGLLLFSVTAASVTGWLYTTDAFWGEQWMEELHEACAIAVLVLASLHVAGVVFTSVRHRENLVAAMIHGRKRPPSGSDIE